MTNLEQLRHQRRVKYISDKRWLLAAYSFSFLAGLSVIASPPPNVTDVVGDVTAYVWAAAAVLGGALCIASVMCDWLILGDRGGRPAATVSKYEVPGIRALALSNIIYAISILFTQLADKQQAGTHLGTFFSLLVPAALYWDQLRRQSRAIAAVTSHGRD